MSRLTDPALVVLVEMSVIETTLAFLQSQGDYGHEGVVLWPGRLSGRTCRVTEALVPEQLTGPFAYRIPDDETFRIVDWTAAHGLVIPVQVHSHPAEAYHSEADDERAFVQHIHALSVVVPDFGDIPPSEFFDASVTYELDETGAWYLLSPEHVRARIQVAVEN
jgi:proteasome lid subunit RPN8/RPN11